MNWKKAIGIGVAAVPGLGAAQAVSRALVLVADTDEERRAVEVLKPKLAQPTPETADAVAGALALMPHRTRSAAGWRPALGWVCVGILAWQYVLRDIVGIFVEFGPAQGELVTVLLAALGNAALRSHDKKNGLTR